MCPIVFQGHPSNFKVTQNKISPISIWIECFRTLTPVSNSPDGIEMMHNAWHSIEKVPIVFRSHPSNFKGKNQWFKSNLRLLGQSQLSNPSDLPCYGLSVLNELKWSNGRKLDSSSTVMVQVFAWHLLGSIPSPISIWFVVNCSFHDSFQWSLSKQGKSEGLIAATGLVILLKLDCHRFFSLCGLEIWWLTLKKIEHLFYTMLSFVHHFKAICEFKL